MGLWKVIEDITVATGMDLNDVSPWDIGRSKDGNAAVTGRRVHIRARAQAPNEPTTYQRLNVFRPVEAAIRLADGESTLLSTSLG